jgi:hypothetical protein
MFVSKCLQCETQLIIENERVLYMETETQTSDVIKKSSNEFDCIVLINESIVPGVFKKQLYRMQEVLLRLKL